ncbi:hypothetical protein L3X38_028104 [Prunus dulcis]|uniref:Uncharacterized protein n=1 Tax=Prunus dulcis TaxID=3755 RepID=A0AAD4VR42_PRUDU|nr:hypothetical protein L3X38_028104 [Prunus dulcis]
MLCNYALVIGESLLSSLMLSHGLASPHSKDTTVENQQPAEASGVARSWVQSMFSRDTASKSTSFSGVRKWTSDGSSGKSVAKIMLFHACLIFDNLHLRLRMGIYIGTQDGMGMLFHVMFDLLLVEMALQKSGLFVRERQCTSLLGTQNGFGRLEWRETQL